MNTSEYITFGKEWTAEISKMTKAQIIEMLKTALTKNKEYEAELETTGLEYHRLTIDGGKCPDANYEFILTPEWAAFVNGCNFFQSEGHGRYADVDVTIDETYFLDGQVLLKRDMPKPADYILSYLYLHDKEEESERSLEDIFFDFIGTEVNTEDNVGLDWLKAAIERGEYSKQPF